MTPEAVLRKVRDLRKLATSSNANEAAAAAAKAEELIATYRLTEVELSEGQEEQPIGQEQLEERARSPLWRKRLRVGLGRHYGCVIRREFWAGSKREKVFMIGRPTDVAIFRYMFAWLAMEVTRLSNREPPAAKNSFALGMVSGILAAIAAAEKKPSQEHSSAAIVLANRYEQVEAWLKTTSPEIRVTQLRRPRVRSLDYARGVVAGQAIPLNDRLAESKEGVRQLAPGEEL